MLPTMRRWTLATTSAVLLTLAVPTAANAQMELPGDPLGPRPTSTPAESAATDFSGTVALSGCSGSIVRWSSSKASDLALMLTNGHCYRFMGAREVVVDIPSVRDVTLLNSDGTTAGTVSTTRLLYATMSTTDVSLYRLGLTYKELEDQYGVPALTLADAKPSPKDQAISIISGYWLTEYKCDMNQFAYRLLEYDWTWRKSVRYEDGGCQVIGGTSGSPILDSERVQIAINNTINEDGQRCTLNNPCEKNRHGKITVHRNRGYGQQTWVFYTCLTGSREIDLDQAGCKLPQP